MLHLDRLSNQSKSKEHCLSHYLLMDGRRTNGFMLFPRALTQTEMQKLCLEFELESSIPFITTIGCGKVCSTSLHNWLKNGTFSLHSSQRISRVNTVVSLKLMWKPLIKVSIIIKLLQIIFPEF